MLRQCLAALVVLAGSAFAEAPAPFPLQIEVYTADEKSYGVTSTIIYGETEMMLVDAQFKQSHAQKLADRLLALNRKLTTIFVTHPDGDHFIGLALLHERFPDAQIYMTAAGVEEFGPSAEEILKLFKGSKIAHEAPDAEPMPAVLPGTTLTVDGQAVEIIADLQGDYPEHAANSAVWIPSLRTLIASDLAFQDVHVYLDKSTPEGRAAWREGLKKLAALEPAIVVAGHKRDASVGNSPGVLAATDAYLAAFEEELARQPDAGAFEAAMTARYPDHAYALFLQVAAKSVYGGDPAE